MDRRKEVEPHVYETSALCYKGLAVNDISQSILVSGESGAGMFLVEVQILTCVSLFAVPLQVKRKRSRFV